MQIENSSKSTRHYHRLTQKDKNVLKEIATQGFQTHGELRAHILNDVHRSHSWRLMKKLVLMGLLQESRGDGGEIRGWSLTAKGEAQFQSNGDDQIVSVKAPNYRTSFTHDLILREIRRILIKSPAVNGWVPEAELRREKMREFSYLRASEKDQKLIGVPDALLFLSTKALGSKAAIELEISQKSQRRIFQRFEIQCTSSDYQFAFYVVEGESLMNLLMQIYKEVLRKSPKVKLQKKLNGIFFTQLSELREKKLDARFQGEADSFVFGDLT